MRSMNLLLPVRTVEADIELATAALGQFKETPKGMAVNYAGAVIRVRAHRCVDDQGIPFEAYPITLSVLGLSNKELGDAGQAVFEALKTVTPGRLYLVNDLETIVATHGVT